MQNEIIYVDWTMAPRCFCQTRNRERAKRLKRIRDRQRRGRKLQMLFGVRPGSMADAVITGGKELLQGTALMCGLLFGPLMIAWLLFGPDIMP